MQLLKSILGWLALIWSVCMCRVSATAETVHFATADALEQFVDKIFVLDVLRADMSLNVDMLNRCERILVSPEFTGISHDDKAKLTRLVYGITKTYELVLKLSDEFLPDENFLVEMLRENAHLFENEPQKQEENVIEIDFERDDARNDAEIHSLLGKFNLAHLMPMPVAAAHRHQVASRKRRFLQPHKAANFFREATNKLMREMQRKLSRLPIIRSG